MGVSREAIFGAAAGEPAVPGTYGEPPAGPRLPDQLSLGAVHLQVSDLARSVDYYQGVLGLALIDRSGQHAALAPQGTTTPLVELHERKGAPPAPRRGRLGLFHFAILLPDRPALGRFVQHLSDIGAHAGAADHLVSEAFYLQDPDNLGIEVYRDRPRAEWRRKGKELMMATDPVDAMGIVESAEGKPWTGMPAGTVMGHLHLHVGDIAAGQQFYSETLGFDRMVWEYPGALFMSAGGYHHHLGTNTWAGAGAKAPEADDAQLLEWTMRFPGVASRESRIERLEATGIAVQREEAGVLVKDPWGTKVRLVA
ncbi:MAG TPA: VOC family protein [Gemmatimonadales bacterium]|nr:VOC family protein [Gemmatimonadales bacterium]